MAQRRLRRIVLLVPGLVLVAAAAAIAAGDSGPQTDPVTATFTLTSGEGKFRLCDGQDGQYAEQEGTFRGTATGDARLTGPVEFTLDRALDNLDTGYGPAHGRWVIRDAASGQKKAASEWSSVDAQDASYGFARGATRDEGTGGEEASGNGDLFANQRVDFTQPNLVVHIGGEWRDSRTPALIASGRCKGQFTKFSFDNSVAARPRTASGIAPWVRGG
jgi:hypothetical protein